MPNKSSTLKIKLQNSQCDATAWAQKRAQPTTVAKECLACGARTAMLQ